MRILAVPRELLQRIEREARASYPEEACGLMFSPASAGGDSLRTVTSVEPAENRSDGERRRRYVILPEALRAAEDRAARRGEAVIGFYHSHPDHPAVPSAFDTEHAWPWYTYLVLAVDPAGTRGVGAFELDSEHERFAPCGLLAIDPTPSLMSPAEGPPKG